MLPENERAGEHGTMYDVFRGKGGGRMCILLCVILNRLSGRDVYIVLHAAGCIPERARVVLGRQINDNG